MDTITFIPKTSSQFYTPDQINALFVQIQQILDNKVDFATGMCEAGLIFGSGGGIINIRTEQQGDLEVPNV